MADILFKQGSHAGFKALQAYEAGALYFTTDEGGLYLGLSNSEVKRIQGSVIFYKDTLNFKTEVVDQPPYSQDVLYFIEKDNALIRYNGSKWIQLNVLVSDFNTLSARVDNLSADVGVASAEGVNATGLYARIEALEELTGTGSGENSLSSRLESLEGWQTTATKTIGENTAAAAAAKGVADDALAKAGVNAQAIAAINNTENGILAQAKSYTDTAKSNVIGASTDASTADTIYGAKKHADNVAATVKSELLGTNDTTKDTIKYAQAVAEDAQNKAGLNAQAIEAINNSTTGILAQAKAYTDTAESDANTYTDEQIAAAKEALAGEKNSDKTLVGAYEAAAAAQAAADSKTTMAAVEAKGYATVTQAQGYANTAESNAKTHANEQVAAAKLALAGEADSTKTLVGAYAAADAAQRAADSKTTMAEVEAKNYATKTEAQGYANTAESNAKAYADSLVAANDAMTFKGILNVSVETETDSVLKDLPGTAKRGDTYKVAAAGTYAGIAAKVGDLFINTADDDEIAVWEHISSGYEDDYIQYLSVADGKIQLSDGITDDAAGTINVVGGSSGSVSVAAVITGDRQNATITITPTFTWGTF